MCTLTVTQSLTLGEIVTAVRRIQRTTTMGVCRNSPRKSGPFHEIGSNGTNRHSSIPVHLSSLPSMVEIVI